MIGEKYERIQKVYSFNFLNFSLWPGEEFHSTFLITEKERNFILTEDLEIHIIEFPKFLNQIQSLRTDFEHWIYLLKESENLKGETMKTLESKNPQIKKAISGLKTISRSAKNRELYEARRKGILDYNSNMSGAYNQGEAEGIRKGIEKTIETVYLGIQINLEVRFNIKNDPIIQKIRKIKDIEKLKTILIHSAKAKTFPEFKKSIK